MRKADLVIFANKERLDFLKTKYSLKNKLTYFLNLPYFEEEHTDGLNEVHRKILLEIDKLKDSGIKLFIHQGVLSIERGREKLATFSKTLSNAKVIILGASEDDFKHFISHYHLDKSVFFYVGSVPYNILNQFWKRGDAAIVMYLPTYINNRLCAPNRFYIAVNNKIPVLVNKDNPVLNNFVKEYNAGGFIEDIQNINDLARFLNHSYPASLMKELIDVESNKFVYFYENI